MFNTEVHTYARDGLSELKDAVDFLEIHTSRKPAPPLTGGQVSPMGTGATEARQPLPAPPQAEREGSTLVSLALPASISCLPLRGGQLMWKPGQGSLQSQIPCDRELSTAHDWHI